MIFASKWYDKSFESIWNSKILKSTDRDEKIAQRSESLIKIAIRFYQTFDVSRDICALVTNANLCEIHEIEIIAADKKIDSQSTREKCRRWRKWLNESLLLQSLVRSLECKESKTRAFECNEGINVDIEFLKHQVDFITRKAISSCR